MSSKLPASWYSNRLERDVNVVRWGDIGMPVLVFPTAGGDAEEIERHKLVEACGELLEAGRIKIYSCDSVAGRAMATSTGSPEYRMWLLNQFHHAVRHELVPAIHADSGGSDQRIVAAGASIGAFNAVALLCRFPDVFEAAVGMSGTYRIQRFLDGAWSDDLFYSSPLDFLRRAQGGAIGASMRLSPANHDRRRLSPRRRAEIGLAASLQYYRLDHKCEIANITAAFC